MKALTICEPWAWCIVDLASQGNPDAKRVENRGEHFPCYTGPLAIHSGKGTIALPMWKQLQDEIERKTGQTIPEYSDIAGRGIIGVCNVVANVGSDLHLFDELLDNVQAACEAAGLTYYAGVQPWIVGARCLLLDKVTALPRPIPIRGSQGLWEVDDDLIRKAMQEDLSIALQRFFQENGYL